MNDIRNKCIICGKAVNGFGMICDDCKDAIEWAKRCMETSKKQREGYPFIKLHEEETVEDEPEEGTVDEKELTYEEALDILLSHVDFSLENMMCKDALKEAIEWAKKCKATPEIIVADGIDENAVEELLRKERPFTKASEIKLEVLSFEEQLGCPLEVREKAFDKGFYDESGNHYTCEHYVPYLKEMHTRGIMSHTSKCFKLKDYKKTWWLKADKSE